MVLVLAMLALVATAPQALAVESRAERQAQLEQDARDDAVARAGEEARRQRDTRPEAVGAGSAQAEADSQDEQSALNSAWDDAVDEAQGVHVDELVSTRFVALVIGLGWLFLLWRRSRMRQRFSRRGGSGPG